MIADPRRGFSSPTEFLLAVMSEGNAVGRDHVRDMRLRDLAAVEPDQRTAPGGLGFLLPQAFSPPSVLATAGSDEQGGYAFTYGGAAQQTSTAAFALGAPSEYDPTASRTLRVPMDEPVLEIPARSDKDHTSSVTGGFTFTRKPEAIGATTSRGAFEQVVLKATSLVGFSYATEELLGKGPSTFAAIVGAAYRDEYAAHILHEKIQGLGGAEYLGVLKSPARITVAKEAGQAADTIVGANVTAMRARCWGYQRAIWMANHDAYEQLVTTTVVNGGAVTSLYQQSRDEERPDMLAGRPIFYNERCSTLGDEGDLILVDWSQYLEGIYQPLAGAESVHVRFVEHERAFKFWTRNAGAPWWRAAMTPDNGAATLSPIVTLAERA